MRTALLASLLCLLAACASAGGNPDGSTGIQCMTTADCPLQDAGGCDAQCTSPENHFTCVGGYCCCACVCNG
jgi:hypothetical protein